ncbi:MAG: N-acetylmuramoyl-L-alanine amidase [Firmicutes bacterium]|nr:N-acetylmuramoyl-L-alanine amidase [Bacillota bacterium]
MRRNTPPSRRADCRGRIVPSLLVAASVAVVLSGGLATHYGSSWPRRIYWPRPPGIVLHHSASPGFDHGKVIDASRIDQWHESRGWGDEALFGEYHIGYHYVVLADGTVQAGRPEWMIGAHCKGYNNHLGICLLGNFSSKANPGGRMQPATPTPAQLKALGALLRRLMKTYHLGPDDIRLHSDLGRTECPGDRLKMDAVLDSIGETPGETAPAEQTGE